MRRLAILILFLLIFSVPLYGCGKKEAANPNSGSEKSHAVKLIANSVWPEDNFMSQGLIDFSKEVKEATNGKVEIEVKAGGSLGFEGAELLKAVKDNLVPISEFLAFGVEGDEPLYGLGTLPFLVKDFEENKLLNDIARPYYDEVAEKKWNQKILYVATWPGAGFWTKDKVESLENLKGLKMRTADGNGARVVQTIGGVPYQLPFAEVYSSLATGAIDSVLTSSPTAVDAKLWEVLDYYVPANVTMGVSFVTMNLDEFNKLDKETQEAIVQSGKNIEELIWEKVKNIDEENEILANKEGITTLEPDENFMNELSDITEKLRKEWLKEAPGEAQEIVEKFYEEVGR